MGWGLGCGTVWRLREYTGVNEVNILPSTPLTHHTHTFKDTTGRGPQERLNIGDRE